jgi:hypothetical protein
MWKTNSPLGASGRQYCSFNHGVVVGLDPDGFIRELRVEPRVDVGPAGSPDRAREIRKQVAAKVAGQLLAAAIASHEDARVDHFPRVADMVLAWLEKGADATE